MDPSTGIIERQRLVIGILSVLLVATAFYAFMETRRERGAANAADAYWQDLYQEREDRKLDLAYTEQLQAKLAQYEARGESLVTLSEVRAVRPKSRQGRR